MSTTRNFSRFIDAIPRYNEHERTPLLLHPLIHAGLLHRTPLNIAALGARLSHESWKRSAPDTDRKLLARLEKMGDDHAKALRGIQYYVLIEAPRYFWAEMDTYTVGTVSLGSTSTMHKEAKGLRGMALVEAKSALQEGTLQMRLKVISYPTAKRIVARRHDHRLPEWEALCGWLSQVIEQEGIHE